MIWIGTALLMGFLGSFHCVGMCGPIALAIPRGHASSSRYLTGRLLYNLGRTTTYTLLGVMMGLFGEGIQFLGWQQGLSIGLGMALLTMLLFQRWESYLIQLPLIARALLWLRQNLGKSLQNPNLPTLFNVGILNGFLPCGFVYMALAGALSMGDLWMGVGFMAFFGLGTNPAMMGLSILKYQLPKQKLLRWQPILQGISLVIVGLLIVRGLNLGIPYVSPKTHETGIVQCE